MLVRAGEESRLSSVDYFFFWLRAGEESRLSDFQCIFMWVRAGKESRLSKSTVSFSGWEQEKNPLIGYRLFLFVGESRRRMSCKALESDVVEQIAEMRPEVEEAVLAAIGNCLTETNLDYGECTVVSNAPLHSQHDRKTAQTETEQNRTEQNRTEQNRTEQNRTEQNRTEQNRTEQNRTEQNDRW
jgi:hypothetical protein